jgi:hypothetical protein
LLLLLLLLTVPSAAASLLLLLLLLLVVVIPGVSLVLFPALLLLLLLLLPACLPAMAASVVVAPNAKGTTFNRPSLCSPELCCSSTLAPASGSKATISVPQDAATMLKYPVPAPASTYTLDPSGVLLRACSSRVVVTGSYMRILWSEEDWGSSHILQVIMINGIAVRVRWKLMRLVAPLAPTAAAGIEELCPCSADVSNKLLEPFLELNLTGVLLLLLLLLLTASLSLLLHAGVRLG